MWKNLFSFWPSIHFARSPLPLNFCACRAVGGPPQNRKPRSKPQRETSPDQADPNRKKDDVTNRDSTLSRDNAHFPGTKLELQVRATCRLPCRPCPEKRNVSLLRTPGTVMVRTATCLLECTREKPGE